MRTTSTALVCILAVAGGVLASRLVEPLVAVVGLIVLAAVGLVLALAGSSNKRRFGLVMCLVVALGLLRGLSLGQGAEARVAQREPPSRVGEGGASLRELEVVGASWPGPRCRIELRDPEGGPTFEVLAEPELCPRWAGEQIALVTLALAPSWRDGIARREHRLRRDLTQWGGVSMWSRGRASEESLGQRARAGYWRFVAQRRQRVWERTRGDPAASLVAAVGLGLRSALAPGTRAQLRDAGLGHLIAVSGLHVAVAALWLQVLMRRLSVALGGSARWGCAIAWLPLLAYVALTGAAPSAVRAAVMLIAIDLATIVGRPHHGPTLLLCAGAAMLLVRPAWCLDPGFALSMSAMAAIVTARAELGVLAMSWRITWVSAPLSVVFFDAVPLHGLIANAVALPLFALLMPLSLVTVLAPAALGQLAGQLAVVVAAPILDLSAILARVPSVGTWPLIGLSLAGLVAHRVTRSRRPATGPEGEPGPPRWLPPKLACLLALLVCGWVALAQLRARERPVQDFDWVALGTVRSRAVLVADPQAGRDTACLYRPVGGAGTWRWLLEELGVRRLARLDARIPSPDPSKQPGAKKAAAASSDPRTRDLAQRLREAGVEVLELAPSGDEDRCPPPPAVELREALRVCRALQGGRGQALVLAHAGRLACRIEARWVALPVSTVSMNRDTQ